MKDPRVYLVHISECIGRIQAYTAGGEGAFASNSMIQDAVVRNLEVIGEAAKRIPEEFRAANPGVPWKGFAGLRDVLIHQYEGVDLTQVWRVVESILPEMAAHINALIPNSQVIEHEISNGS